MLICNDESLLLFLSCSLFYFPYYSHENLCGFRLGSYGQLRERQSKEMVPLDDIYHGANRLINYSHLF